MNLPRPRNPFSRLRNWVQANRAQAEIAVIASFAIGLIVLMFVATLVIIVRMQR